MRKIDYGNALATGEAPFWVEGDLAISALEQVAFLQRLYRNRLPLPVEHQRLVKDVMINEAGPDWILRAKTGWTGRDRKSTRLNSSHLVISYAVFCLEKK